MITQKRLKELLDYNPETGIFTWKIDRGPMKAFAIAGNVNKILGYRQIRVDKKLYFASRLAFLWMEGYFPEHTVDHINRIRDDDRWKNIRHVTQMCNSLNMGIRCDNKSGVVGVCWYKAGSKWDAEIQTGGKKYYLGRFDTKLEAVKKRLAAEVAHNYPNCNSNSTAFLYLQKHSAI